ncbi:hypothetical protein DFP72DRAFT_806875, partial [Ephemerocybe angulata]
ARRAYHDPATRHDLGRMDVECPHCHALHWMDEKLSKSSTASPKFGVCCGQGKVKLDAIPEPPALLRNMFTSMDPLYIKFREDVWKYNRAFSFTSLGVHEDHSVNGRGRGPPVFRISGELHHYSGALEAPNGQRPRYSQLYILEPQAALDHRKALNTGLNAAIINTLQGILLQSHQYVPVYQHAYEILQHYDPRNDIKVHLRLTPGLDKRRYNLPTADEVAVLLPEQGAATRGRNIILRTRQNGAFLDRISELHPAYVPLQYPLLFPHGTNGWHQSLTLEGGGTGRGGGDDNEGENDEQEDGRRLTLCRYTSYRIMFHQNEFNLLLRGGRLFNRYNR